MLYNWSYFSMKTFRTTITFKSCQFKLYNSAMNNKEKKRRIIEASKISPRRSSLAKFSQNKARESSSLFFFAVFVIKVDMFFALAISANFRPNRPLTLLSAFLKENRIQQSIEYKKLTVTYCSSRLNSFSSHCLLHDHKPVPVHSLVEDSSMSCT